MIQARARAPGRVNLIGEHTDYNGGFVMPCAIGYYTVAHASRRTDSGITISAAYEDARTVQYVTGIIAELRAYGCAIPGLDLNVGGDLPLGAGLSSSASLEVAVALAALAVAGAQIQRIKLAHLAQRAEAEHAGARVGIMDQFAVLFAQTGKAIFLDTRNLEHQLLALPRDVAIVICNTMVKHEVAGTEYNERRRQCEKCVRVLSRKYAGVKELRDVTPEMLRDAADMLDPVLYRRAVHVVRENGRVLQAREALQRGDVRRFGQLMNESHESLRDLYEVSSPELDALVEEAKAQPGVYGARMTGGGFGGCTVTLVERAKAEQVRARIAQGYRDRTGILPEMYDGTPVSGAQLL